MARLRRAAGGLGLAPPPYPIGWGGAAWAASPLASVAVRPSRPRFLAAFGISENFGLFWDISLLLFGGISGIIGIDGTNGMSGLSAPCSLGVAVVSSVSAVAAPPVSAVLVSAGWSSPRSPVDRAGFAPGLLVVRRSPRSFSGWVVAVAFPSAAAARPFASAWSRRLGLGLRVRRVPARSSLAVSVPVSAASAAAWVGGSRG
jgi:hypothetical protein